MVKLECVRFPFHPSFPTPLPSPPFPLLHPSLFILNSPSSPHPSFLPTFPLPSPPYPLPSHTHFPPLHSLSHCEAAPSNPARGSGGVLLSSPSGVRVAAPAANAFLWHYSPGNASGDSNFWLPSSAEVKFQVWCEHKDTESVED